MVAFAFADYFATCSWLWTCVIALEGLLTVYRYSARSFDLLHSYQHAIWFVSLLTVAGVPLKNDLESNKHNYPGTHPCSAAGLGIIAG